LICSEHRRKGLATTALMETMKKSAELGAEYFIDGSRDFLCLHRL
jgi:hypothetical protein